MRKILLFSVLLFVFPLAIHFQSSEKPRVDSPQPGEVIYGKVIISGNTDLSGFTKAEVYFGYSGSTTWFPIIALDQPVRNGPITQWDTTVIADGNYQLKVSVKLRDGTSADTIVNNLEVRNTQILAASITQAISISPTAEITATAISTPILRTATFLPANPAGVEIGTLNKVMIFSGIGTAGLFTLVILLRLIRSKTK